MIHELFPENYKGNDNTSNIKKKALARADHIFCISQNTKKDLMNILNIQDKKITVVHLGVDIRECERTKKNNSYSKPYLLYVGKRFGYKNFSRFLLAVGESTLLKRNFNIIAFGGGAFSSDEVDLITKVGLSARQVIHINGNDQMLQNLYSNASAFIYPSLYEGFGLPPLEAMACGCPVISSNTSSMPEVISNAGVYFNPNSVDDIRYQIERTVFDDELLDNLIAKGYARAKNFTWKKCADKTLKAYQLALGKC